MHTRTLIATGLGLAVAVAISLWFWPWEQQPQSTSNPTTGDIQAESVSAPDVAPSVATAPNPQTTTSAVASAGLTELATADETTLMAKLHEWKETNPIASLQLARDGNARYPNTRDAVERNWIIVKSLVNLHRFDEAKAEAQTMVAKYPDEPLALDVQRHLLTHPLY